MVIQTAVSTPHCWCTSLAAVNAPYLRHTIAIFGRFGAQLFSRSTTELATALLWANERNLYRATVAQFSSQDWNHLIQTITAIWAGAILYQPDTD